MNRAEKNARGKGSRAIYHLAMGMEAVVAELRKSVT